MIFMGFVMKIPQKQGQKPRESRQNIFAKKG